MFNFGFQEQYVALLENSFKSFASLKNPSDFERLFRDHDELNQLSRDTIDKSTVTAFEWKLVHKRFRILFIESQVSNSILFLIPYESYSTWVEAEFNSQKGEYSGERGRLNPYVNSNAQIKYFPVTSVGYPVVLLTSIGKNMTDTTMTSLIDNYFNNPEL